MQTGANVNVEKSVVRESKVDTSTRLCVPPLLKLHPLKVQRVKVPKKIVVPSTSQPRHFLPPVSDADVDDS